MTTWSLEEIRQRAEQAARDAEAAGAKGMTVHMEYGCCVSFTYPPMVESQRRRQRHQINSLIRQSGGQ